MTETIPLLKLPCPVCRYHLLFAEDYIGKKVQCPGCGGLFTVLPPKTANIKVPIPRDAGDDQQHRHPGVLCPSCNKMTRTKPVFEDQVTTTGWVIFVLLLLFCFPLLCLVLHFQENYRGCTHCGRWLRVPRSLFTKNGEF